MIALRVFTRPWVVVSAIFGTFVAMHDTVGDTDEGHCAKGERGAIGSKTYLNATPHKHDFAS
jgi:hypothetical protein